MIGLQASFIILIVVMMIVVFALACTIGDKVTAESRQVEKRTHYIVGDKEENKHTEKEETPEEKEKKKIRAQRSLLTKATDKIAEELTKSDVLMKPEEFMIIWVAITFIPALVTLVILKNEVLSPMLMIIGAILPMMFLKNKQKKRKAAFESQLSDALMIASNCIKSGLTFSQAMETIADECEDPIKSEFKRTVNEITFGSSQEAALESMAQRVKSADFMLVVSAVSVQRQTGGNLSEILDIIAGTIRERMKIKGEIKTLTGQGRMSGIIIGALPVALMLIMAIISKDYVMVFFTTTIGNILLAISISLEVIGALIINKIVTIKF